MTFAPPKDTSTRRALFLQGGERCWYCGCVLRFHAYGSWEIEHQTPRCAGGGNCRENLVISCTNCNRLKSGRDVEGFREFLHTLIGSSFTGLFEMLRAYVDPAQEQSEACRDAADLYGAKWRRVGRVTFYGERSGS